MKKTSRGHRPRQQVSADELLTKWKEQLESLWHETSCLFWSRKMYRAIAHMFQTNPELQKHGQDVWHWIRMLYGREAVMGIRRDMDDQKNAISLVNLLRDLEANATVLTRERHRQVCGSPQHWMSPQTDQDFKAAGGPPGPGTPQDHVRAEAIAGDRRALEEATAGPVRYANLVLAHRQPLDTSVPFKDIDEALSALYRCFRKYSALVTGADLLTPTPIAQFDWLRPFRIAWITKDFDLPRDEWDL